MAPSHAQKRSLRVVNCKTSPLCEPMYSWCFSVSAKWKFIDGKLSFQTAEGYPLIQSVQSIDSVYRCVTP